MLRDRVDFIRRAVYIVELIALSLNFFAIYFFAAHHNQLYSADLFPTIQFLQKPYSIDLYMRAFWLVLVIWAALLHLRGEYQHFRVQTYWKLVSSSFLNGIIFLGFFTSLAFLLKMNFLSRMFILLYSGSSTLLLVALRTSVLATAFYLRKHGHNAKNIILVGTGRRAQEFLSQMARHREWGYRLIGLLDVEASMKGKKIAGHEVLGTIEELPKLIDRHVVDEVLFVVPRTWLAQIEKCILYCEAVGIPATLSTDFFDLEIAHGIPLEMGGFTYLTFETSRLKQSELIVKRMVDITISALSLLVSLPVFIAVAILTKISSKGPVFFKQVRSGLNGRRFTLYKFRTMVPGAEAKLEELRKHNEMSGPVFKMKNDPRVTPIGRFLRKTSLDEFPQFWNVLKGDMSLVGPRPPIPKEVEQYEPWQRRRLSMKPGITCIWQVSGRSNIDFEQWMKLDLQYIDHWTPWLDIKLFFQTIKAVLARSGAK